MKNDFESSGKTAPPLQNASLSGKFLQRRKTEGSVKFGNEGSERKGRMRSTEGMKIGKERKRSGEREDEESMISELKMPSKRGDGSKRWEAKRR